MYKLLAIDIDGTLLNDQKEITKEVNEAIQVARMMDVKVILCTGRPIIGIHPFIEALRLNEREEYVVTFNGALVQNTITNEVVSQTSLTYQDLKIIYDLSLNVSSHMHFFDSDKLYTPNKDIHRYTVYEAASNNIPVHYVDIDQVSKDIMIPKIMFIEEPERLEKVITAIPDSFKERYAMVKSAPFFLEILHHSVSKGNAVRQVAERLGIRREEIICIGDGDNDLSMIQYAGCGVAMANATRRVKEAAQFITLSNNENGVAYALEKLVFRKYL